jgi:hypothetical protein
MTVTVNGRGDLALEGNETFFVNLSSPREAVIADSQGQGTIVNDDCSETDEGRGNASFIGTVNGDTDSTQLNRNGRICPGDADWYRVRLAEVNIFGDEDLLARVDLFVPNNPPQSGGDIDMQIFRANGSFVGSSSNGGTTDELFSVRKVDSGLGIDSTDFYVRVVGFGSVINSYQLRVTGDTTAGPIGNL